MEPSIAAVRGAVRRGIVGLPGGGCVLVALSGGPDSTALAAALAAEAPRAGLRAGSVTVDHDRQPGSTARAAEAADLAGQLGLSPALVIRAGQPARGSGPEGTARAARYAALDEAADDQQAVAVLLGHTRDDQAETVLLRLARGSGARSLSGMAPVRGRYRRPFLDLPRSACVQACVAWQLPFWRDPTNEDTALLRNRVRHRVLPALEADLGPGVAAALARTAALLRDDADALDHWATEVAAAADPLAADTLARLPAGVRRRVLRRHAVLAGCPAGALTAEHLAAVDALVVAWHGQKAVSLPGGHSVSRRCGRLCFDADGRGGG
jgi:tRNA(Ile)-lysidine synthase